MNSLEPAVHLRTRLLPGYGSRNWRSTLSSAHYRVWRENEIIRLELLISRSVLSRTRLLRVNQTVHVATLLVANERHLLRLGSALTTLTAVPCILSELLNAAADAVTIPA